MTSPINQTTLSNIEDILAKYQYWFSHQFTHPKDGLTREQATQAIEAEINKARLSERKEVALDNYRGKTFSDSTNYKGKFDKFVTNNEKRIAELTPTQKGKE